MSGKIRETFFSVLGLHRGSNEVEVKQAWKKKSRETHPDANIGKAVSAEKLAQKFSDLSQAYSVLRDSVLRKAYEGRLDITGDSCEICQGKGFKSKQQGFTGRIVRPCEFCGGAGRVLRSGCIPPEKSVGGAK